MRISSTFALYIARQFAGWFLAVFLVLSLLILLVDLVELLRRSANRDDVTFGLVIEMSLLRLPNTAQKVLPFSILFAAMGSFWRLTRNNELTIVRGAGVSAWQFLLPVMAAVIALGVFRVTVFNPLSASLMARYDELDRRYMQGDPSTLSLSQSGIWLREARDDGYAIVNAGSWAPEDATLYQVLIYQTDSEDRFMQRLDAGSAVIEPGNWELRDVAVNQAGALPQMVDTLDFPTRLTISELQDSLASPETVSFWDLERYAELLDLAGFPSRALRVHWHASVAEPLLLCGMVLVAAGFSLRHARRSGLFFIFAAGITVSFGLYILTDIVLALGISARIPIELAGWAPAGIVMLLGLSMLLHLEDG